MVVRRLVGDPSQLPRPHPYNVNERQFKFRYLLYDSIDGHLLQQAVDYWALEFGSSSELAMLLYLWESSYYWSNSCQFWGLPQERSLIMWT